MTRRLPEYTIQYDREGYFIATEDGWDLCRTYRFGSYQHAREKLEQWMAEDAEAYAIEQEMRDEIA